MKRLQTTLTLFLLFNLAFLSVPLTAESSALPLPFSDLHQVIDQINSPRDLVRFMRSNFKFYDDQKLFGVVDHWQSPEEFWELRKGDCEDYAIFSKYILDSLGIESYVVSFYGDLGYAHTVTIYKQNGKYNVINEDRHYEYNEKSIHKVLSRIYPQWIWGGIAEKKGHRGAMIERLTNQDYKANSSFRANFAEFPF